MKKLELQNFGVVEMDANEKREIDGGILLGPFATLIGAVKFGIGFVEGFLDGMDEKYPSKKKNPNMV